MCAELHGDSDDAPGLRGASAEADAQVRRLDLKPVVERTSERDGLGQADDRARCAGVETCPLEVLRLAVVGRRGVECLEVDGFRGRAV